MRFQLEKYKSIHPGIILERLLAKKEIAQRPFALSIEEHPQTINAITKGRRSLNTALALKIEATLGLEVMKPKSKSLLIFMDKKR